LLRGPKPPASAKTLRQAPHKSFTSKPRAAATAKTTGSGGNKKKSKREKSDSSGFCKMVKGASKIAGSFFAGILGGGLAFLFLSEEHDNSPIEMRPMADIARVKKKDKVSAALETLDSPQAGLVSATEESQESSLKGRKVVVIVGASGNIGKETALAALARGHFVIATSRTPAVKGLTPDLEVQDKLKIVQTPDEQTHNPKFWEEFFVSHLKDGDEVIVVSTVGGAHGDDLRHLNITVPHAIFSGLEASQDQVKYGKLTARQCSSIAAPLMIGDYGQTKHESDQALLNLKRLPVQIVRIGMVIDNHKGVPANPHPYTFLEMAIASKIAMGVSFQPMLGHHSVPMQPVAIDDVAEALVSQRTTEDRIVHAVGPEVLTQGSMTEFYCKLLGLKYRPMAVSLKAAELLAKHHAKGHFAPYAVEYCLKFEKGEPVTFSHQELENLLGRPLTKFEDMYLDNLDQLVLTRAPFKGHLKEIVLKVVKNPRAAWDTAQALGHQFVFTLFKRTKPPKS